MEDIDDFVAFGHFFIHLNLCALSILLKIMILMPTLNGHRTIAHFSLPRQPRAFLKHQRPYAYSRAPKHGRRRRRRACQPGLASPLRWVRGGNHPCAKTKRPCPSPASPAAFGRAAVRIWSLMFQERPGSSWEAEMSAYGAH